MKDIWNTDPDKWRTMDLIEKLRYLAGYNTPESMVAPIRRKNTINVLVSTLNYTADFIEYIEQKNIEEFEKKLKGFLDH